MKQIASSWSVVCTNQNQKSAFLEAHYSCPFCGKAVSIELSVDGSEYFDTVMSGSFEFDAICSECDKEVVVECTEDGLSNRYNGRFSVRS